MAVDTVRIPRPGGDVGGLLAVPEGDGPFPGVVVIPTIMGLNDFAHHIVSRLAGDGFVALAVDIFDHPGVPAEPMKRSGAQPDAQVLGDLDAALAMLQGDPRVEARAVCAWGYCIGGRFALLWPAYQPALAAAAAFHGFPRNDTTQANTPTEPAGLVAQLTVPVIAFFGEADALVPMDAVRYYEGQLRAHGKDFEVHTYPDVDHGWTNPGNANYREAAAEDCWPRAVRFLRDRIAARRGVGV
jgi:carboxymethylenebutenolidase